MTATETRVAALEAEVRALKRTVAALAPALAENILREMAARGALLVVKTTSAADMAEILARSAVQALDKVKSIAEKEEDEKEEKEKEAEEGGPAVVAKASDVEEQSVMKKSKKKEEKAVAIKEKAKLVEVAVPKVADEDSAMEDEEVEQSTGTAVVIEDEGDNEDRRMDVDTSQESASSVHKVSASSDEGDLMPLSLSAFDEAVGYAGNGETFASPSTSAPTRIPSRPPMIIPVKNTKSPTSVTVPKKQRDSKGKPAQPTTTPEATTPSTSRVPTQNSVPARVPSQISLPARAPAQVPVPAKISVPAPAALPPMAAVPAQAPVPVPVPTRTSPPTSAAPHLSAPMLTPLPAWTLDQAPVPSFVSLPPAPGSWAELPEDFEVQTKDSVAVAWEKWCCGDAARGVPPLRNIGSKQVTVKAVSRRLSDLRCAMMPIEILAQTNRMWRDNFTPREAADVYAALESQLPYFTANATGADGRKRKKEVAWSTALNNMRKKRKQQGLIQHEGGIDQALI